MLKRVKYSILLILILLVGCPQHRQDQVQPEVEHTTEAILPEHVLSELTVPANVLNSPNVKGQFTFAGEPKDTETRNLTRLQNIAYIAAYDEVRNCPAWVVFRIPSNVQFFDYHRFNFRTDNRTQSQVKTSYYTNSGFDRGHMAPSYGIYAFFGEQAERETYFMSNICPQTGELNRVRWKQLEQLIAGTHDGNNENFWAKQYGELWIITGPIYEGDVEFLTSTTPNIPDIEIPDKFFKIVIGVDEANSEIYVLSFIMPNSTDHSVTRKQMKEYLVSVDAIEEATGLDFFTGLNDNIEEELERTVQTEIWPIGPSS